MITTAIGSAVPRPPSPTSGAAAAPHRNCPTPSRAEADPAASGCPDSASAVVFGSTMPIIDTARNSGGSSQISRCEPEATAASTPRPPARCTASAALSRVPGATRPSSIPLTWLASTMPSALTPKMIPNVCGDTP